jgi:nicotinamidase/pyrazinamidase
MVKDSALIVVDVQNDFCPGGALGVSGGDEIIPLINRYIALLRERGAQVIASRDWHPPVTSHFGEFGGVWPVHCVQGSSGARFHEGLRLPLDCVVFSKGMDPERNDYSALAARNSEGTLLTDFLWRKGLRRLYICGLATDYCILQTALSGLKEGFSIFILSDAVRGVDLTPGDSERAMAEMKAAGARLINIHRLASTIKLSVQSQP